MTIREAAERAGISNQAIYKRLKARGIRPESIREPGTNKLTAEGERIMRELFPVIDEEEARPDPPASEEPAAAPPDELARLTTELEGLRQRVDELTTRLTTAEARAQALQDERDYLRGALDKAQQIQALTASKLPTPPPALPDGEERQRRGLLSWLRGWGRGTGER